MNDILSSKYIVQNLKKEVNEKHVTNNHTVLFLSNVLGQAHQVTFVTGTGTLLIQMHILNVLKLSCITTFQVNLKYFESMRVLNDSHSSFTNVLNYSFLIRLSLPKFRFSQFLLEQPGAVSGLLSLWVIAMALTLFCAKIQNGRHLSYSVGSNKSFR